MQYGASLPASLPYLDASLQFTLCFFSVAVDFMNFLGDKNYDLHFKIFLIDSDPMNTALSACPHRAFPGAAAALSGVQTHLLPHPQTCPWSPARATAGQAPRRGLTAQGRDPVSCPPQSWPEKVQRRAARGSEKPNQKAQQEGGGDPSCPSPFSAHLPVWTPRGISRATGSKRRSGRFSPAPFLGEMT